VNYNYSTFLILSAVFEIVNNVTVHGLPLHPTETKTLQGSCFAAKLSQTVNDIGLSAKKRPAELANVI
jgi:hypothetical protein